MKDLLATHDSGAEIWTGWAAIDWDWLMVSIKLSYWGPGLSDDDIKTAVDCSVCYSLFVDGAQMGFARLVTDYSRFAWLSDVILDEAVRGQGLGGWMIGEMLATPTAKRLRRILLSTDDAFGFYERFGFVRLADTTFMQLQPNSSASC